MSWSMGKLWLLSLLGDLRLSSTESISKAKVPCHTIGNILETKVPDCTTDNTSLIASVLSCTISCGSSVSPEVRF